MGNQTDMDKKMETLFYMMKANNDMITQMYNSQFNGVIFTLEQKGWLVGSIEMLKNEGWFVRKMTQKEFGIHKVKANSNKKDLKNFKKEIKMDRKQKLCYQCGRKLRLSNSERHWICRTKVLTKWIGCGRIIHVNMRKKGVYI